MNSVSREENTLTCLRVFIYLCVKRETPQKTKHHLDLTSFLLSSLSSLCNIPPLICLFQISSVSLLIKWWTLLCKFCWYLKWFSFWSSVVWHLSIHGGTGIRCCPSLIRTCENVSWFNTFCSPPLKCCSNTTCIYVNLSSSRMLTQMFIPMYECWIWSEGEQWHRPG